MAFKNVSPQALNNAITTCKNSIKYNESLMSLNAISSGNIWQTNAKSKLNNALNKLVNEKYQAIINQLDTISSASSLIAKYKNLEEQNEDYNYQIYNLMNNDLYYDQQITTKGLDENGQEIDVITTTRVVDPYVENQIQKLKYKVKENSEKMINYEKQVANLIKGE